MTSDAPSLKIKRMNKSKGQRGGSTRPATVVRHEISQFSAINQTAMLASDSNLGHDSILMRDYQTNQSNTILGDISLLSKIGGDSKGQIMVMPNLNYGGAGHSKHGNVNSNNILINQSS